MNGDGNGRHNIQGIKYANADFGFLLNFKTFSFFLLLLFGKKFLIQHVMMRFKMDNFH